MARPLGQRLAATSSLGDYNPNRETSRRQKINQEKAAPAFDHGF